MSADSKCRSNVPAAFSVVTHGGYDYLARTADLDKITAYFHHPDPTADPMALDGFLRSIRFEATPAGSLLDRQTSRSDADAVALVTSTLEAAFDDSPIFRAIVHGYMEVGPHQPLVIKVDGATNAYFYDDHRIEFDFDVEVEKYGPGYVHRSSNAESVIIHEVVHALTKLTDGASSGPVITSATALIDPGPTVVVTNEVMQDMGLLGAIRIAYVVPAQNTDPMITQILSGEAVSAPGRHPHEIWREDHDCPTPEAVDRAVEAMVRFEDLGDGMSLDRLFTLA